MTASEGPRTAEQRRADAERFLSALHADAWVSTASPGGKEHLVPLSIGWDGERVVLATVADAATTRNIQASGRARLALGSTRDVVMIDAVLDTVVEIAAAPASIVDTFAAQSDWDPRHSSGYVFVVLRPRRVQVWREVDEIADRTVMRDGRWSA